MLKNRIFICDTSNLNLVFYFVGDGIWIEDLQNRHCSFYPPNSTKFEDWKYIITETLNGDKNFWIREIPYNEKYLTHRIPEIRKVAKDEKKGC